MFKLNSLFENHWFNLIIITVFGLLILIGKYDWGISFSSSKSSYLMSAYLYILLVSFIHISLTIFFNVRLANLVSITISLVLNFPISLFGLKKFYYFADRPIYYCDRINKVIGCEDQRLNNFLLERQDINWLPDLNKMFPNELIFFVFLLVVGLLILLRFKKIINRKIKIFFIFYLLIVLQTLFHNSLWSPITYITYFFAPDQITRDQFTWFAFLFPDGSGAVNADYISVHNLQKIFNGFEYEATQSIRRSFVIYFASNFTYFVNPTYVYLSINIISWMLAAIGMYYLVYELFKNNRIAFISAFFVSTGTGFIFVVGQSAPHTLGYSLYVLVPMFFEILVVKRKKTNIEDIILISVFVSICLLVYDILPILVGVLIYCYFRNGNLEKTAVGIIIGYLIFKAYLYLIFNILKFPNYENVANLQAAIQTFYNYLTNFDFSYFYFNLVWTFTYIFNNIAILFFIFVPVLAIIGMILFKPKNISESFSILSLGVPALIIIIFFTMGRSGLETMPRFVYGIYPMIYLFAAVALNNLFEKNNSIYKNYILFSLLFIVFLINNFDILGFPSMYYHFYYGSGNYISQEILNLQ